MKLDERTSGELQKMLRDMSQRSKLYALIKAEMKQRGQWKAKPRGAAFKKGQDERRHKL